MRNNIIIAVIALAEGLAFGYWAMPQKVKTEVKTVEVEVVKHEVTTIKEKPDGTKETVITSDSKAESVSKESTKSSVIAKHTINVSALAGFDAFNTHVPVYGLSLSKEFIGPITIGAWGLTSGVVGVSLGMNF